MNRLVISKQIELVIQKLPQKKTSLQVQMASLENSQHFKKNLSLFFTTLKNRKGRNTFYTSHISPEEQNQYYICVYVCVCLERERNLLEGTDSPNYGGLDVPQAAFYKLETQENVYNSV